MFDLMRLKVEMEQEHIRAFEPYSRQLDVIESTKHAAVTWMSSCNGGGKTALGAAINVWHWTGEYPEDYSGLRIDECGEYWVLSTDANTLKNGIQEQLFRGGTFEDIEQDWKDYKRGWKGTDVNRGGKMPKRCILEMEKQSHMSTKDAYIARLKVRHKSGGVNTVKFFPYLLGAKKFAAKHNLLFWHCDEVPPEDVYEEIKARQTTSKLGIKGIITATPELAADQNMIKAAFDDKWIKNGNARVVVDITQVPDEVIPNKAQRIANCSPKYAPAKLHGLPVNGSVFFSLDPTEFTISRGEWINLQRKNTYRVINGIDFGFNDDAALACLYTNVSDGTVILDRSVRKSEMSPPEFATFARSAGFKIGDIPCAWPHDGMRRDKDMTTKKEGKEAKRTVAEFYKNAGFKMMPEKTKRFLKEAMKHAVFEEIEHKAKEGLFYIVSGNHEFEEEWRGLQLGLDGKVSGKDHILDAVCCAWQNKQFGKKPEAKRTNNNWWANNAMSDVSPHLFR